jgi:hypothetical protein
MTKRIPAIPLHDPRFKYVPAALTDIRVTFAKARQQVKQTLKRVV